MITIKKDLNDITISATDARNNWSSVVDSVIREKPKFIKRTRDCMFLSDISVLENVLSAYTFTADRYVEDDGSITLGLVEIDLAENGKDDEEVLKKMAKAILEYAEDYYKEFNLFYSTTNRKNHMPYVIKSLLLNDLNKIGGLITCRPGEI
jgi:electron transfer flavoprotein alpha subunit